MEFRRLQAGLVLQRLFVTEEPFDFRLSLDELVLQPETKQQRATLKFPPTKMWLHLLSRQFCWTW